MMTMYYKCVENWSLKADVTTRFFPLILLNVVAFVLCFRHLSLLSSFSSAAVSADETGELPRCDLTHHLFG